MEKMRMESADITAQNVEKLGALFPNCITEMLDEEQSTTEKKVYKKAVNFELLKQMLSGNVLDGDEAYEFTWVGKKASIVEANKPIRKTLRPCKEESVDWDTTENLYIEGDNLEVLKLLQESYLSKVKMIYIDPPYNTGNDFIYNDDFKMTGEEYADESGEINEDGNRMFKNTDSNGRFHSDWCSMIYSRLMLARNLLSDDGVIFISINDDELENLRNICNEIFNRSNLIANFCWRTDGNFDNQARVKTCHEYILMYAKNQSKIPAPSVIDPNVSEKSKLNKELIRNTIVKNGPKNPISDVVIPRGFPCDMENGIIETDSINYPKYSDNLKIENGVLKNDVIATTGWASKGQLLQFIRSNFNKVVDTKGQEATFVISKTGAIECIKKRSSKQSHVISVLQNMGGTQKAAIDLGELSDYFDYPKPVILLKYLESMLTSENDIIFDFFSGSATTAHAVMQLNAEDGGHRKFIMVQLPEQIDEKSEAFKAGYKNICEIGKERIRRAGIKIKEDNPLTTQDLDVGFRVLKLDDSNMNDVYYSPAEYSQDLLSMLESNVKSDRNDLDLLFGCLLEWGLPLSLPYCSEQIEDYTVHNYNDGDLIACFEEDVPDSVIKEIAKRQPLRAVFRDSSFANSPSKINVEEIFKLIAPDTRIKVI